METDEIELIPLAPSKNKRGMLYFSAVAAYFSSISFGATLGYGSPALVDLEHTSRFEIDDNIKSWFNGLLALGALIGGILSGISTERLGRKTTIILISVPYVLGWLMISYANSVALLLTGRFITGVCVGASSLTVPVYLAEVSPPKLRGLLGSCVQLSVTIGVLVVYLAGNYLVWSWLAIFCVSFPLISMIMMLVSPETPHWLISHKRQSEALKSLRYLHGATINVEAECQAIEVSILQQTSNKFSFSDICLPQIWKPLCLSLMLMFFQQAQGNNNIIQNAETIFSESSTSFVDPKWATIITAVFMVIATLVGSLLMDRLGRKVLLIFSGITITISLGAFGTYYYLDEATQKGIAWLPLVSLIIFIVVFSVGYGPIPWLMMGELFPLKVRGFASGIATAFNWTCVFIVTKEFQDTLNFFGKAGTYWFYAATSFVSCFCVYFLLPETKGKSLEEIEASFLKENSNIVTVPINEMI